MEPTRCLVYCPNTLQDVLKVLDLILLNLWIENKKSKPVQDVYTHTALQKYQRITDIKVKTVNKNCVQLMNQSLCCQRYKTAVKLLWIVSQDIKVIGSYLFKAALLTFDNLNFPNKEEFIWNLTRVIHKLGFILRREVTLEYLTFGIQNNVSDLPKKAKELDRHGKTKYGKKKDIVDTLFEAYSSVLQYTESGGSIDDIQASQAVITTESTILQLKNLVSSPGDWDIFVLKLIKMLALCDRGEEIEEVLEKYVESNNNNPNAHIYLCVYLCKFSSDTEKIVHSLEVLANLCPFDERVLLLLEQWSKIEGKLNDCLKLNFMFLDYPSNGGNLLAWQLLSKILSQVKLRNYKDELRKVQSLWKSRRKCWCWLYFNPSQVPDLNECDYYVTQMKIQVLLYFDKEHEYIKQVSVKFPFIEILPS